MNAKSFSVQMATTCLLRDVFFVQVREKEHQSGVAATKVDLIGRCDNRFTASVNAATTFNNVVCSFAATLQLST